MKTDNKRPLKVIFFLHNLVFGGCERVVSILIQEFVKRDIEVDLVLLNGDGRTYPIPDKVRVLDSFCVSISFIQVIKRIRRYINDESNKYNVVIIPLLEYTIQYVSLAALGLGVPVLVSERNNPYKENVTFKQKLKAHLYFGLADKCVFQTAEARSYYRYVKDKNAVVIKNPVPVIPFEWKGNLSHHSIICVGRLVEQKNFRLAIDIIDSLKDRYPDITLDIYGEGILECELKKYAKQLIDDGFINFCGVTKDVVMRMSEYSVFLQTSDYEGISNTLLEAMSIGMPIVATATAGSSEILRHGTGLIFPIGDKGRACQHIISIFDNELIARSMADAARQEIQNYSPEMIADQWLDLINGMLSPEL